MTNQHNLAVNKIGKYLKRHLATDAGQTGGSPGARGRHGVAPRIRQRRRIERFVGARPMRCTWNNFPVSLESDDHSQACKG